MKLKTSNKVYNERMEICKGCKHFRKSVSQCKKCGCFMKLKAKVSFTKCPDGKWEREREITSDQYSILKRLLESIEGNKLKRQQNIGLTNLYNEIFGLKKSVSSCSSCVAQIVNDLKKVLESYES